MTTRTSQDSWSDAPVHWRDYFPEHGKTRPYPAQMEQFLTFTLIPVWLIVGLSILFAPSRVETYVLFFGVGGALLGTQILKTKNPSGKFSRTVVYLAPFLAVGTVAYLVGRFFMVATQDPHSSAPLVDFSEFMSTATSAIVGVLLLALTFTWATVKKHNNHPNHT